MSPWPLCPNADPGHPHIVHVDFPCAPMGTLGGPLSPPHCPHGPPHALRGTLVTLTQSPWPPLCPRGTPGHLCAVPTVPWYPQEGPCHSHIVPTALPVPQGVCCDPCTVPTAPWRPKKSPGTKKRVSRARRPPSPAQPQPHRQDVTSSPPSPVTSDSSGVIPMLPEVAAGSPGGDSDREQHATGSRSSWGNSPGMVRDRVSLTDSEDDEELIPLRDMLLAGYTSPSPPRHQQVSPYPRGGPWGHPSATGRCGPHRHVTLLR